MESQPWFPGQYKYGAGRKGGHGEGLMEDVRGKLQQHREEQGTGGWSRKQGNTPV